MSAYRHLAPAEREHINSVRTGAQQCLSMEPTAPVRRRRNTTTDTRLAGARATPYATTSPSGMSCQSAWQERIGGRGSRYRCWRGWPLFAVGETL